MKIPIKQQICCRDNGRARPERIHLIPQSEAALLNGQFRVTHRATFQLVILECNLLTWNVNFRSAMSDGPDATPLIAVKGNLEAHRKLVGSHTNSLVQNHAPDRPFAFA